MVQKLVRVYIDDNLVFQRPYEKEVGELAGIRYRFLGSGEVNDLKIFDATSQKVYDLKNEVFSK